MVHSGRGAVEGVAGGALLGAVTEGVYLDLEGKMSKSIPGSFLRPRPRLMSLLLLRLCM